MEIYTLKLTLPIVYPKKDWYRIIEIPEDFYLYELHDFIQYVVNFDDDHLYEFFLAKDPKTRQQTELSDELKLNEVYPAPGKRLFYLFDFGDCWLFQINKSRKKLSLNRRAKYPRVVESVGRKPKQYGW